MRTRTLGRSGLQVSEISLGSWLTLGSRVDFGETPRLVHRAFDLGIPVNELPDFFGIGLNQGGVILSEFSYALVDSF